MTVRITIKTRTERKNKTVQGPQNSIHWRIESARKTENEVGDGKKGGEKKKTKRRRGDEKKKKKRRKKEEGVRGSADQKEERERAKREERTRPEEVREREERERERIEIILCILKP